MRRVSPRLITTLAIAVALALAACNGGNGPPPTTIAFYEANATTIARGDTVTLSWQIDNPDSAPDAPSCSITRRAENEPAEQPFPVACTGGLNEIPPAPATASYIRYQLNALKRPRDAANRYISQTITINFDEPTTTDTTITLFEANATNIARGDTVTLTWQVDDPGSAPGVASCSITRRAENEPAEQPFPVACAGSLSEIPPAPITSSFVRYQLNALKDPPDPTDPYLTSTITINLDTIVEPETTYATSAGGTSSDNARAVSALADGSAIVTGYFDGTATFGGTSLTSTGSTDVFVARTNPDGTWAWANRAGGTSFDLANGVSALADGSAIVVGEFDGFAAFGANTLSGSFAGFVARINADGTWAWATGVGDNGFVSAWGVSTLTDGGAIVSGEFEGSVSFGATTLFSAGDSDVFVARINADGTWAWAARAGGTSFDRGYGVSTLADGSAIIVGNFREAASFGTTTLTSAGGNDAFVARINADGTWAWASRAGGPVIDYAWDVSALSDGSAIVIGDFEGTASFGTTTLTSAGGLDVFVARINADGTWAWATRAGGTSGSWGWGVSALSDGSAIVTGDFGDTASFGATTLTSAGSADAFVARINANGTWAWATQAGGTNSTSARGVDALSDGSTIITGTFNGTATFGTTSLTSAGAEDMFVAKLDSFGAW